MRRPLLRTLAGAALLAALSGAAGGAPLIDDVAYTRPQALIGIAPHLRLNLYCTGSGTPTVVFDSGLGDATRVWGLVQPMIAQHARACSYDRAGLGFSDDPIRPSNAANAVDDLHRLLAAAHIDPPYVLVGHSLGGMHVKLYAETYPAQVAGLVYVDPSHEDLGKGAWAIDPDSRKTYAPYIDILHRCLRAKPNEFVPGSELAQNCGPFEDPHYSAAINAVERRLGTRPGRLRARIAEQENAWFTSADQVRAGYRPLGDIPIIVLTHSALPRGPAETQEQRDAKNRLWLDLHGQIAGMSSRGQRITVEHSDHYIQLAQPQIVADAILQVVGATQGH